MHGENRRLKTRVRYDFRECVEVLKARVQRSVTCGINYFEDNNMYIKQFHVLKLVSLLNP